MAIFSAAISIYRQTEKSHLFPITAFFFQADLLHNPNPKSLRGATSRLPTSDRHWQGHNQSEEQRRVNSWSSPRKGRQASFLLPSYPSPASLAAEAVRTTPAAAAHCEERCCAASVPPSWPCNTQLMPRRPPGEAELGGTGTRDVAGCPGAAGRLPLARSRASTRRWAACPGGVCSSNRMQQPNVTSFADVDGHLGSVSPSRLICSRGSVHRNFWD